MRNGRTRHSKIHQIERSFLYASQPSTKQFHNYKIIFSLLNFKLVRFNYQAANFKQNTFNPPGTQSITTEMELAYVIASV
jgi:hypothetical protein